MRTLITAKHKKRDIVFETDDMMELVRFASERHMKLSNFDIEMVVTPNVPVEHINITLNLDYEGF